MPGPVWRAKLSVASPISHESGSSATPANTNSVNSPTASSRSKTTTSGPSNSSSVSSAPRAIFLLALRTVTLLRDARTRSRAASRAAAERPALRPRPVCLLRERHFAGRCDEKGGRRRAKPPQSLQIRTHERAERDDMQPAGSDVVQRPCGQASAVKCGPLRPARGDVFPRSSLLSASRCRSRLAGRPTLQAGGHRFDPGTLHEDLEAEESG